MAVSASQIFGYLVQKHGVSTASAAGILANIQYESNFNPSAIGDNGTSGGLFQHHKSRWSNLKSYAASTGRAWSDWTAQVDFAMKEAKSMGLNLQATDPVAASKEWTIKFERPANMYQKAEQRAKVVGNYMKLDPNSNYTTPTPAGTVGDGNAMPTETQEQLNIPEGGTWYRDPNGGYIVAYPVFGEGYAKSKAVVYYKSPQAPPSGTRVYRGDNNLKTAMAGWVDGGSVDSFRGVPAGKSFGELVNETLFELGLAGSNALGDKGVMAVVALAMTREVSPTELANRLRQTQWYQDRTDKEREWDDLSDEEKRQRLVEAASQLASSWFTYVGEDLQLGSYDRNGDGVIHADEIRKGNPELYSWAGRIASGKTTVVTAVNTWMKDVAAENPESPWSRTVREEQKNQGQHNVDIANAAGQIRDLYNQWGVAISDAKAEHLAGQVVMNEMALEEVEEELKTQANALYPHKPPNVATRDYAEPFMQTYQQFLETSEPDLMDNHIQSALSQGMNLADFRDLLRQDDRWLETDNARGEMNQQVSGLGRLMGF